MKLKISLLQIKGVSSTVAAARHINNIEWLITSSQVDMYKQSYNKGAQG
jgi:hypothetical protein